MTIDNNQIAELLGLVPQSIQRRVDEKLEWAMQEIQAKLATTGRPYKPRKPIVTYDLTGVVAGYAIGTGRIKLNRDLLCNPKYTDDMINDTLVHEYAHIVALDLFPTSKPHGYHWQMIMHLLGLKPTRCHNYDVQPRKRTARPHTYYCACKVHNVTNTIHRRIQSGRSYHCSSCGGLLTSDPQ